MINLMFCGNDKVLDGMIISLLSIVKYTKVPLNIFILTMNLQDMNENYRAITKEQVVELEKIVKRVNVESKIRLIDITKYFKQEMINSANINTHYTPYILVRLFSDKIEELPDKILYLDSDIVCYNNIEQLYNTDIQEYDFAAAIDYLGQFFINRKYINSGVLLMNLKRMKQLGYLEKCRKMCVEKKMLLPDQSALNKICKNKLYLPRKYNEQKKRQEDTVIRHFSMTIKFLPYIKFQNIKPWHIDRIHNEYKINDFDDILKDYIKIKENIDKEN